MGTEQPITGMSKFKNWVAEKLGVTPMPENNQHPEKEAEYSRNRAFNYRWDAFTGEMNLGEVGPVKDYFLDYDILRARSWQLYLESDVCQMGINRFARWVIGSGLVLQAIPETTLLESEGIDIDSEQFNRIVESRFKVYANNKMSDFADMRSLSEISHTAFVNAIVGGDVLVILRVVKGVVKMQLIDGCHVSNPMSVTYAASGDLYYNGHIIRNGVEIDEDGKHLAYHVQFSPFEWRRIEARNPKTKQVMAYLVYGQDFRIDDTRGMSLLTSVIETAKTLERYKKATVGSAEERQNIPYFIQHGVNSNEENPFQKGLAKVRDFRPNVDDVPTDYEGRQLADQVYASTQKQTFNMPIDSKIVSLESKQELYFKDFHTTIGDDIFATIGIPPNVARMLYDSNFSASRAALKDWEHTLIVMRERFYRMFYKPVYALWMDTEVMKLKIPAPGYIQALMVNDEMILCAYRSAVMTGANVPHIDPVKEVTAERLKLGAAFANVPLTTVEAATMAVNGGDSENNIEQAATELEKSNDLGILPHVEPKITLTDVQD